MSPVESVRTGDEVLAEEVAALYEVGSAILTTLDVDEVLHLVCERAQELLGGDGAWIAEYERDGDEFVFRATSGTLDAVRGDHYPSGGSVAGLVWKRREPVVENDVETAAAGAVAREIPVEVKRVIAVPLEGREGVLGVLGVIVGTASGEGFAEADGEILSAFATQAALAVENAHLYARARDRAETLAILREEREEFIRRLEALHQAELHVASDVDLERLLQTIADEARRLTGARYAALGVLNDDGDGLTRFITSGLGEEERARYEREPTGRGLLGAVIEEREAIRVRSIDDDERASGVPDWHFEPTSFLGVPVRTGEEAFGNLYLTNKEGAEEFTERDQTIVSMLATQAAVAIDKARLFEEREELIESLRTAQRVRARLTAYVNHDVRNALHGVALWVERLEKRLDLRQDEGQEEGELAGMVRKIRRGSDHALRLVKEVLDLARLEEGRLQTWPRRVSVPELLHAARDAILPEAERQEIVVGEPEVPADLVVVADPDRVHQITLNLLSNAVKFSEAGSRVLLSAEERARAPGEAEAESGWVAISVADEGPGIPAEDRERIFGEYEQADPEGEGRRGSGLGLTLSRQLARLMDGDLTLESEVGEGSTFTLWLPRGVEAKTRPGWIG